MSYDFDFSMLLTLSSIAGIGGVVRGGKRAVDLELENRSQSDSKPLELQRHR